MRGKHGEYMDMPQATVYIIDDDSAVRQSLQWLLESVNLHVRTCADAQGFLQLANAELHGCLICDVRMPGMSGLELQSLLVQRGIDLPVIIITGHGDVTMAVRALKAGAIEFIEKPFNEQQIVRSVRHALELSERRLQKKRVTEDVMNRISSLTQRENEVLGGVVSGMSSKKIGEKLGISGKTIEVHRAKMMLKMSAGSIAELVKMVLTVNAGAGREASR